MSIIIIIIIIIIRTPLQYGQFPMYQHNSHAFPLKKPLQYGPSLIRTTDTKSRPLGANSYKLNFFITDTANQVSMICGMYRFLSSVTPTLTVHQSAIPMPERVKMLVFKTDIYNCKLSKGRTIRNNRRWGDNSSKKIPARETCPKKNPLTVRLKKKFL